ncbi:MAG: enolase C-terminal domain-like protein [Verrucomicrobiota bacterium]
MEPHLKPLAAGFNRRRFIETTALLAGGLIAQTKTLAKDPSVTIKDVRIVKGVAIEADNGVIGTATGSGNQNLPALAKHLPKIRELLIGQNPLDFTLGGATLWEGIFPGKAKEFGEMRDPLTGELRLNKVRGSRHTETGRLFIGFSTADTALWDLRARLLQKPAYQIIGPAQRAQVAVYWRPGEVGIEPMEAKRKARDAYDRGYRSQKWYFAKGAQDGEAGFKANVELVRALREELPDATLMFDNHSIRYSDDVDYSLRLCKAVAPFKPFWIEEPICPEHVDGYARIKGETGLPIAGGEHWYTRWAVKAFLDRKCVDFVQSDPTWCGGISEWLEVCKLVRQYPGVMVVPHITSPWTVAPHCVASQPETLCPILEYNSEQGLKTLDKHMRPQSDGRMNMVMPQEPGFS